MAVVRSFQLMVWEKKRTESRADRTTPAAAMAALLRNDNLIQGDLKKKSITSMYRSHIRLHASEKRDGALQCYLRLGEREVSSRALLHG